MSNIQKVTVVVTAVIAVLYSGAGPSKAQDLSGAEFMSIHAGNCVSYSGPSTGTQCFGADGSTSYDDQAYGKDTGIWEVRGDDVCTNWKKEPGWDCGPISRTQSNNFTDGEYSWTVK